MDKTQVWFVGAGPGAPDLITVRGRNILAAADVIIYTGSLVNPALLDYAKEGAVLHNSARMTLEQILAVTTEAVDRGLTVCRLHTGDPSLYGAVREQLDALADRGIRCEMCPGVTAAFGAAASMELEYTLPGLSQSLILTRMAGRTAVPERESIESFAAHRSTMAIYLSAGMTEELSTRLIAGGYPADTPAAVVYKATWPEEKCCRCTVGTLHEAAAAQGITKTALILIGEAIGKSGYERSRLYDRHFATAFRAAEPEEEV